MTMQRLTEIVKRVMSAPLTVHEGSRFIEDLGFSSVNAIMLIALIEQEFSIDLEAHMAQLMRIQTVGEAAEFISTVSRGAER